MKWLIAVDSSRHSLHAFETALSMMDREHDELLILSVVEETSTGVMSPYADYSFVLMIDKKVEEETRKLLKHYAIRCKEEKIKFCCLLAKGSPKDCIWYDNHRYLVLE
jgi:nucleotide-binding universal stress UspA family protein